jgi:signal peptidase I
MRRPTKYYLKKAWHFIWEEDSWASWAVNVVLAFIIIKFLVYPGLGLFFGTTHPIVAVVSSSMEHNWEFNEWWISPALCGNSACLQSQFYENEGISKNEFHQFRFWNGFNKGDLMILVGTKPEKIVVGDIIVFRSYRPDPIIHRVISVTNTNSGIIFRTKGDNNPQSFSFEEAIPQQNLVGRAAIRIPLLGYVKIWFVQLLGLMGVNWS